MAGMVSRNRPVQVCLQIDTQTAAALQYYQTAMIILELAQAPPQASAGTALQNLGHITSLTQALGNRASKICALALSSDSAAVWINSFGPIAFCRLFCLISMPVLPLLTKKIGGCWIRDINQVEEVIQGVQEWGTRTGWPVVDIVRSLRTPFRSFSENSCHRL